MNVCVRTSLLLLVAVTAAPAPGASAQERLGLPDAESLPAAVARFGGDADPRQFGTSDWFTKVIPATAFSPAASDVTYGQQFGYYYKSAGDHPFWAALDLPPGTEINEVCVFAYDGSTTDDISMAWLIHQLGDPTHQAHFTELATATTDTAATPGYTTLCASTGSPVPVRAYADGDGDGDGDGDYEYNSHYVFLNVPPTPVMRWSSIRVQWRRVISPAPTPATFPNDVPTTHPFFQYIEALAASGITAGCSPGSFCPDLPLTRGQMAVFLTGGLGLYWPY